MIEKRKCPRCGFELKFGVAIGKPENPADPFALARGVGPDRILFYGGASGVCMDECPHCDSALEDVSPEEK